MDTSLLLSLVGIFISLYTIADSSKRRNLKYRFSLIHSIIFSFLLILFLTTLIFEGYFSIESNNKEFDTLTIYNFHYKLYYSIDYLLSVISFLLVIILSIYFAFILFSSKIRLRSSFIDNLHVQYNSNDYGKVISDLGKFFDSLMKYYSISEKLPEENNLTFLIKGREELTKLQIIRNKIVNMINLRKYKYSRKLENFLDLILNDLAFIKELSIKDPYLAIKVINSNLNIEIKRNFLNLFLRDLIKTKGSILHRQIKFNQNINITTDAYMLYPKNYITYSLFRNIEYAEQLYAWMPVGDGVIEYLTEQGRDKEDVENRKEGDYGEKCWNSPVFVGIRYFDIMVKESLVQNATWHMWLYYFTYFTNHIVQNIKYPDGQDGEFANMYEYYLFEIFVCYRDWIEWANDGRKNYNVELEDMSHNHENGNIIKSAIISLTQSMDDISDSDNLREEFKEKLFSMVLNLYFKLKLSQNDKAKNYAKVLITCLKYQIKGYSRFNSKLLEKINETLRIMDLIPVKFQQNGSEAVDEFEREMEILRQTN